MSRNSIIRLIITLGVLIAVSCTFVNIPNLIPPTATQGASVIITASQGGELTLPDKTVLNIPAGSLQNDTQVSIQKVVDASAPGVQEEMTKVGAAYQINLGTSGLVKPARLEIPIDSALLPNGTKPSQVFLSYYDEVAKKWVFAGGKVDTNRNVVVLEITHASLWMPATWNWAAWIAVLDKLGQVGIVNWIQAAQLLAASCSQTGNYVKVNSTQELNMIQGCVEQDDSQHPVLRIVNPKSFYYEIMPISGGNGYPDDTMLGPGDDVKFTASTSDPSPLVIQAQITQKAGVFLIIHMVITMLPGLDQFGIQSSQVACVVQRLSDASYFASAAESLSVDHDGAAAAESISKFMLNADAVQRFLTAAEDCNVVPAPTWSIEGIEQIGGAFSTILSSTDYITNYLAQNSGAQVSFNWSEPGPGIPIGDWQGNLSCDSPQNDKQIVSTVIRIKNDCGGVSSPCVNLHLANLQNDMLMPFIKKNEMGYCFGFDVHRVCLLPQNNGTLQVNIQILLAMRAATMFFEVCNNGILNKIVP
jgi:hypothetical protein